MGSSLGCWVLGHHVEMFRPNRLQRARLEHNTHQGINGQDLSKTGTRGPQQARLTQLAPSGRKGSSGCPWSQRASQGSKIPKSGAPVGFQKAQEDLTETQGDPKSAYGPNTPRMGPKGLLWAPKAPKARPWGPLGPLVAPKGPL